MAKLSDDPITIKDIEGYVKSESSFALELRVLRKMEALGFKCKHGGLYSDPYTKKTREFDIRAEIDYPAGSSMIDKINISLAVECKSLNKNYPLVIFCVPRQENECKYSVMISVPPKDGVRANYRYMGLRDHKGCFRIIPHRHSLFELGGYVGKSLNQLGKCDSKQANKYKAEDSEVFDKWSQALSSMVGLVESQMGLGIKFSSKVLANSFPIIVVPDNCLFRVEFTNEGKFEHISEPRFIPYYIGKRQCFGCYIGVDENCEFEISHLFFATESGLGYLIEEIQDFATTATNKLNYL